MTSNPPVYTFRFIITLRQSYSSTLRLVAMPRAVGGQWGKMARFEIPLKEVGGGPLQVSIVWDTDTDVDLHLDVPGNSLFGGEIYYSHKVDGNGELDLDSNPACALDHIRNENITYARGAPANGDYVVRVDYYSDCSGQNADWVVTVWKQGKVDIFPGHFDAGDADGGSKGSGVDVHAFTWPPP
jgi:hypothetical protein